MTSELDRRFLLGLAREALSAHVNGTTTVAFGRQLVFNRRAGAFVSLHKGNELRGCVGHSKADQPLAVVVSRCAVAAGSADPRFSAIRPDELSAVTIEISVLGTFEPAEGPAAVEVGRHGLMVSSGARSGLLLPQVAARWHWDSETFVVQTCLKASLSADAWRRGATLHRFEAEVFRER